MEILGGINQMTEDIGAILTISGGFNIKTQHIENQIAIGNSSNYYVKNKLLEWSAFQDKYYENGKLVDIQKNYNNFLCVLNDIFPLPIYTTDENEILFLINNIYNAKDDKLMNALTNSINMFDTLYSSIRHLFMIYKVYVENRIEIFVKLRNDYIQKFKLSNKTNNFMELVDRWNSIDIENKINTSSTILFFNFPSHDTTLEKTIPKIHWEINDNPKDSKHIHSKITQFLAIIKKNKFSYIGYCPYAAIHRFKLLLKFPIKELNQLIQLLDYNHKHKNINTACSNIVNKIVQLTPALTYLSTTGLKIKRVKTPNINKFPKISQIQKIKIYEKYINAFVKLYKDMLPHLVTKEKKINNLAININNIAKEFQKLQML